MLKTRKSKERSTFSTIPQQNQSLKQSKYQSSSLSSSYMGMGLEKIQTSLVYNRYLAQLRNNQNYDAFMGNEIAQQKKKKHQNRFHQASQQIISNYAYKFVKQAKQPQIKWTCQYKQSQINDQIIKISEKVDEFLQKSFIIPKIEKQGQLKTQTNSTNINIDIKQNNEKLDKYDSDCVNIQNQRKFEKQGVNLGLISNYLSKKVKRMAFDSLDLTQQSQKKIRTHKDLPMSLYAQLVFEPSVQNHSNFSNNFSFNSKVEKKKLRNNRFSSSNQSNKQNEDLINTAMMNSKDSTFLDSTIIKRIKKANLSEGDLEAVFKNYQIKKQKYGKNKNLMTQKRQQGLFTNQLIKIANKIGSEDIFSSLQFKKQLIKQQIDPSLSNIQQLREVNKQTPNNDLKQKCRKEFQYLAKLSAQKL